MCLLHCQETMFSLPTSCVPCGNPMVSKENQLDRGSRSLRKTIDHMGKPIIQFSKQRKRENHVENHPQVEGSHRLFSRINSSHTPKIWDSWHILCLWPQPEPSLIISLGSIDLFFSAHIKHQVPLYLKDSFVTLLLRANSRFPEHWKWGRLDAQLGFFVTQLCRFSIFQAARA